MMAELTWMAQKMAHIKGYADMTRMHGIYRLVRAQIIYGRKEPPINYVRSMILSVQIDGETPFFFMSGLKKLNQSDISKKKKKTQKGPLQRKTKTPVPSPPRKKKKKNISIIVYIRLQTPPV